MHAAKMCALREARIDHPKFLPRCMSRIDAAHHVGVSPVSFDRMVEAGTMPRPRRALPTNRKIWDVRELDDAVDALPHEGDGNGVDTWHDYGAAQVEAR